jgi:hypothetical protein
MMKFLKPLSSTNLVLAVLLISTTCRSQTDQDAIMMNKYQFCSGFIYGYSSWDNYWEGTLKRTNENLGTYTNQSVMFMANYGITNDLNIMAGAPYVWTKASAGTLAGMKGIQDLSVFLKWRALERQKGDNKLSMFLIGGFSTPLSDYAIDFLPMSIGLGSTNAIFRGMVDFKHKTWFATATAAYVYRSNVKLDRNSYYDTELHLTNEVEMPNSASYLLRAGYRGRYVIAEALLSNWNTLGGFDMTRNNMPFPSNDMEATNLGAGFKWTWKKHTGLSAVGNVNYTLKGRNVGQATSFSAGIFYAFYMKAGKQKDKNTNLN